MSLQTSLREESAAEFNQMESEEDSFNVTFKGVSKPSHGSSSPMRPTWSQRMSSLFDDGGVTATVVFVICLCIFGFISFVLACVATSKADNNSKEIEKLNNMVETLKAEMHTVQEICPVDITYGQQPTPGEGNFYQVVGGSEAALTWHEAKQDAESRCFDGHQGYLANILTAGEDMFLLGLIQSSPEYVEGSNAWIGASDMSTEGMFSWTGPGGMTTTPFYANGSPVDGAYTNWADGEPNEGDAAGSGVQKSEDCVAKYGGESGKWNDQNCYYTNPFFVVQYSA